jgi:hypothetical protein
MSAQVKKNSRFKKKAQTAKFKSWIRLKTRSLLSQRSK